MRTLRRIISNVHFTKKNINAHSKNETHKRPFYEENINTNFTNNFNVQFYEEKTLTDILRRIISNARFTKKKYNANFTKNNIEWTFYEEKF